MHDVNEGERRNAYRQDDAINPEFTLILEWAGGNAGAQNRPHTETG